MTTEPRAMREIHEIRLKIYETTKNMTHEERAAYANEIATRMVKEYNLKMDSSRSKP